MERATTTAIGFAFETFHESWLRAQRMILQLAEMEKQHKAMIAGGESAAARHLHFLGRLVTCVTGQGHPMLTSRPCRAKRLDELEEPEDDEELSMERTFPPHPQPADIVTELLPFQREFLTWARLQEHSAARGGILADEMGLGKVRVLRFC